jgi:hypothetical protein
MVFGQPVRVSRSASRSVISATSMSPRSPPVVLSRPGCHRSAGRRPIAERTSASRSKPTEYSTLRSAAWFCRWHQSIRSWEAPAPSEVISSRRR